jgi:hypothetical protein
MAHVRWAPIEMGRSPGGEPSQKESRVDGPLKRASGWRRERRRGPLAPERVGAPYAGISRILHPRGRVCCGRRRDFLPPTLPWRRCSGAAPRGASGKRRRRRQGAPRTFIFYGSALPSRPGPPKWRGFLFPVGDSCVLFSPVPFWVPVRLLSAFPLDALSPPFPFA